MFHFCTYFDHRYLPRALALHASLVRHAGPFRLHVLCMDDLTFESLQARSLPEIVPHRLADLEAWEPRLGRIRSERNSVEYYFTCTPCVPLYMLDQYPDLDHIIYLDADLYFYSDPTPLLTRLRTASVLMLGHRFPPHLVHLEEFGIYNVGLVGFRADGAGRACLGRWRDRCLEWCFDRREGDRYADQRYLDDWPEQFPGVAVAADKGANLAPWNVGGHVLRASGGKVFVDGEPLIFYHFHGVRPISRRVFNLGLNQYHVRLGPVLQQHVYRPYLDQLATYLPPNASASTSPRGPADWALRGPRLFVTNTLVAELSPEAMADDAAAYHNVDTPADDPSSLLALAALARQRQKLLDETAGTIGVLSADLRRKEEAIQALSELPALLRQRDETIRDLSEAVRQKDASIYAMSTALLAEEGKEHVRMIAELASLAEHRLVLLLQKEEAVNQLQAFQAQTSGGRYALRVLATAGWRRIARLLRL